VDGQNALLRILAEWRCNKNREREFNRNSSAVENERNNIKKAEIRIWKEELVELIPESEFKTCGLCESLQMPKSDHRRSRGFVWECLVNEVVRLVLIEKRFEPFEVLTTMITFECSLILSPPFTLIGIAGTVAEMVL